MSARWLALFLLLDLWACGPSPARPRAAPELAPAPTKRKFLAEAQAALVQNNVADAWLLLRNVPDTSSDAAKAKALIAQIQPKVLQLTDRLVAKAEEALNDGLFKKGVDILTEVVARLAPVGPKGADVAKKLAVAKEKLVQLKTEYDRKLSSANVRLSKGDGAEAYRQLARAAELAEDQGFAWTFSDEQRLELARLETPPSQRAATSQRELRRKRQSAPAGEVVAGAVDNFSNQEQEIARLKDVRDLVEEARDHKKKGRVYDAIVKLQEARKRDPDSAAVRLGLDSLESDRLRLIEEYLELADRAFAQQELDHAVKYFRLVLRLEPDNLRAKEAIQMHENLERIKQERSEAK